MLLGRAEVLEALGRELTVGLELVVGLTFAVVGLETPAPAVEPLRPPLFCGR